MLLAVDLGNTNIKCGVFSGAQLRSTARTETRTDRSAEAYVAVLRELLSFHCIAANEIDGCVMASVVPSLTGVIEAAIERAFGCAPLLVGNGTDGDIPMLVDNPTEVGADRIVNAVAARELFLRDANAAHSEQNTKRGVIVVDLGTATKLDCVSPRGEFLGGVIAPGVQIGLDALAARGAQLRQVELVAPPRAIGKNTTHCVQSGVVYGHAALIDGLIARLRAELAFDVDVVATGGLASVVAPHTATLRRIEPDLTLQGLRILYERKSGSAEHSA